jgi:uncharacterized protein
VAHRRIASARLRTLLRQFPAVTIVGPRQIGKSTLAQSAFGGFDYFDLENPDDMDRLRRDPAFALSRTKRVILDEAQRLPEIFPILRSLIDRQPSMKVIILGSASPGLVTKISESLAGRTSIFELGGISVFEDEPRTLWVRGGYPRVHWSRPRAQPENWYPAYLRTCIEQDIPQLGFRLSAVRMRTLLGMLAHSQGGLLNLSELGGSLGVNYHAVAHLIDVLEGVFLVRRLPPYHRNLGKRLVKSPKVYVRDTGILHSLLGMPFNEKSILAHPKAGASFETFCIEQILTLARLADPSAQGYFFRTHTGVEVDLLLELRGRLLPIEIKLGSSIPDLKNLQICMKDLDLTEGYVVALTTKPVAAAPGIRLLGLHDLAGELGIAPRQRKEKDASRRG